MRIKEQETRLTLQEYDDDDDDDDDDNERRKGEKRTEDGIAGEVRKKNMKRREKENGTIL